VLVYTRGRSCTRAPVRNDRLTAVIVGALYIVGTVSGILSVVATSALLTSENPFLTIAGNPGKLHPGAFFVLVMGVSLAAMPVFLYPLFRKKNEAPARCRRRPAAIAPAQEVTRYILYQYEYRRQRSSSIPHPFRIPSGYGSPPGYPNALARQAGALG